ncbi:hypothetical protein Dsin_008077 [Dipteronia sinensis]|uniref:RNase H type-1 domain-containing protein n=1 Tax=Dipteronia sinensis TaxID=43782 RepID=A0AAE0B2T8_9ROSI|nr:hypothetical protein Dsin_008077 [Dipteronia sinensis]
MDTGLYPCEVELDAKVVVNWINSQTLLCSDIGNVVSDIHHLLELAHFESIVFIPIKANQVAHGLAKNSLSCVEDLFWLEDFPSCVDLFVSADRRVCL